MDVVVPTDSARAERSWLPSARLLANLAPIAIALLSAFLAFERLQKATRRTLWAEDATLFLRDAVRGQNDLFTVYAGYLHVVPRAAATLVVSLVDARRYAIGINLSACLITGVVAAVVYIGAEDVVPDELPRLWLALITVVLPLLGVEVLASLANLHTVMMWGAFWALMRQPRTLSGAIVLACFELLATLSEVQSVFLVPLALLLLWRNRSLRQALVVAACTLGAGCQLLSALTNQRDSAPHWLSVALVAQLLAMEVVLPLWVVGTRHVHALLEHYGWGVAIAAAMPLFIGFGLSMRHGSAGQRIAACAAAGVGLLIFCVSHMLNGAVMGGPDYSALDTAPVLIRYAVGPSLFLLAPLAIGLASALRENARAASWLGGAAMAALLFGQITHFRTPVTVREPETSWTKQISEARAACRAKGSVEVVFQVSPSPWAVAVPCSRL